MSLVCLSFSLMEVEVNPRTKETNLVTVSQGAQKYLSWSRGPRVLFDGSMEIIIIKTKKKRRRYYFGES